MKAKEFIPSSKPRNFVAKNQKTAGAGAHKDKKKSEKQGDVKHKNKMYDEDAAGVGIVTKQNATVDVPVGGEYMNVKKLFPKKKKVKESNVMEYETHRYTDDEGNEWEVNDEGDKTLIRAGRGSSHRSGSRYSNPRLSRSYDQPKGMYFYNVNDPQTAQKLGLKQSKSGKWYLPAGSFQKDTADKVFGPGKYWEPKK